MHRSRRRLLAAACGAAALGGCSITLEHGLFNPCRPELPADLARDGAVLAAWDGIDASLVWDSHVHLVGGGGSSSGIWLNPAMSSVLRPLLYAQSMFYRNAGCPNPNSGPVDDRFVERLLHLLEGMRPRVKAILLAMDWHRTEDGEPSPAATTLHVPNEYAMATAARHRRYFEWAASIHPYREDCVEALERATRDGARAVKWLPAAMGIDPASPRCDRFYHALARLDVPLISHAGLERAVLGGYTQDFGNPLRLRRALAMGVRVVVAHCASMGEDRDLDRGPDGPTVDSFELFARMMDEPRHERRLFADISAMTQVNRAGPALARVIERSEWHPRLLNGSDYPLPGVMPIYSVDYLVSLGLVRETAAAPLKEIRAHNPLLFDFVLKRHLRSSGKALSGNIFETRAFFERV